MDEKLLEIDNLSIHFKNQRNLTKAVDGVNLYINKGEVVSVVGESGSGKTTLGRAALSLIPFTNGHVKFDGQYIPSSPDLRKKYNNHKWMAKNMQMIFQDPYDSLHPTWNVYKALTQGIKYNSPFINKGKDIRANKELITWKVYFSFIKDSVNEKKANALLDIRENKIKELKNQRNREIITLKSEVQSAKRQKTSLNFEKFATEEERIEAFKQINAVLNHKKQMLKDFSDEKMKNEIAKLNEKNKKQLEQWNTKFTGEVNKEVLKDLNKKEFAKKKESLKAYWTFRQQEKKELHAKVKTLKEDLKLKKINKNKYNTNKTNVIQEFNFKMLEFKNDLYEQLETFTVELIKAYDKKDAYAVSTFMTKNEISRFSRFKHKAFLVGISSKFLEAVGLSGSILNQPVGDLSGGQRQRISIARTLMMNPKFLVADEPISALDVSIQAQVINILKSLVKKLDISMLFIAHDLRMVRYISDRIYIMFRGKIVEYGDTESIFANPVHPYTKTLLSAIPSIKIIRKGIESFKYDFTQDLLERHEHKFINVSKTTKEHFVLGTEELIEKWDKTTKEFKKNFNFD